MRVDRQSNYNYLMMTHKMDGIPHTKKNCQGQQGITQGQVLISRWYFITRLQDNASGSSMYYYPIYLENQQRD